MSNRVYCIQVHLLLAGLLNRTLIIDSTPQGSLRNDYDWSLLVHAPHLRACFGIPLVHPGHSPGAPRGAVPVMVSLPGLKGLVEGEVEGGVGQGHRLVGMRGLEVGLGVVYRWC